MYVITNREIVDGRKGLSQFGKKLNEKGANELRAVRVTREGRSTKVEVLRDKLHAATAARLIEQHNLPLDPDEQYYASLRVACDVFEQAQCDKCHILFYIHGYNNDMRDVVQQAFDLERRYGVIVIAFSWPANGGGLRGVASYKADKRDARASAGALERTLQITHRYFRLLTESRRRVLFEKADGKHPNNPVQRDLLYSKLLDMDCPFTVNALFHSMGNYLLKQMLKSTITEGNALNFDNIVLAAADTNNLDHALWVEQLNTRSRCFVAINERDYALGASRAKTGSDQLARLGHYLRSLDAKNAHYINFTNAKGVERSHSYFDDNADENDQVFHFFARAFKGEAAEDALIYHPEGNWYGFVGL